MKKPDRGERMAESELKRDIIGYELACTLILARLKERAK